MGAIELGKIPIIVFCTGRAMKGIPLGITTQALLKNICRSVCFDGSIARTLCREFIYSTCSGRPRNHEKPVIFLKGPIPQPQEPSEKATGKVGAASNRAKKAT
jgi:hypothetical protein